MKSEKLQDAIGMIGEDLIADARTVTKKAKPQWIKWTTMAAALVMAVVLVNIPSVREKALFIVNGTTQRTIRFPESGIKEKQESEFYAIKDAQINIQRDLAQGQDFDSLSVCYSKEYEVLYYINFADSNFIYRLKDGEAKLAVKIPANHLYMYDGELYFRVEGGEYKLEDMKAGDICKYSPRTGEVTKLVEGMASTWMTVAEDCIYFETKKAVFRYDLDSDVAERINAYPGSVFWKEDYCVAPYEAEGVRGLGLYKIGDDYSKVTPLIMEEGNNIYSIEGNKLYCAGKGYFNIVNLDTGVIYKYPYIDDTIGHFVIQNNRAYDQQLNYFIDLNTGEYCKLYTENPDYIGYISRLFSANGKLYAICYKVGYMPEIIEITIVEDKHWHSTNMTFEEHVKWLSMANGKNLYTKARRLVLYNWKRMGE